MDDEYFRLNLSIRHSAKRPISKSVADAAMRGLGRDQNTRFRKRFFQGVREADIKTLDGIYIGRRGTYNVDLARLDKVAMRIVRGLYFHHYHKPMPTWCEVDVWCVDGFGGADPSVIQTIIRLQQEPPTEIGEGVFKYWHSLADGGDSYSSAWLLLFYESTAFFGVTIGRRS